MHPLFTTLFTNKRHGVYEQCLRTVFTNMFTNSVYEQVFTNSVYEQCLRTVFTKWQGLFTNTVYEQGPPVYEQPLFANIP